MITGYWLLRDLRALELHAAGVPGTTTELLEAAGQDPASRRRVTVRLRVKLSRARVVPDLAFCSETLTIVPSGLLREG